MSKRLFPIVLVFFMLALVLLALPVTAQETLTYDEPVLGELTADVGAVEYTFTGNAGDVVFIIYQPVDILADLDRPKLLLTAPGGVEMIAIDSWGQTEAAAWLPEDGEYSVVATREEEESVGEFSLAVHLVPEIAPGKAYTTVMNNDEIRFFYTEGGQPFMLNYTKMDGDFSPALSVNVIREDFDPGSLDAMALIEGEQVERGMVAVSGQSDLYIIVLAEALFDFNFDTVSVEFVLTLELIDE